MAQSSFIRRFFGAIGRGIDMLRTVLGRLLFVVLLGLVLYVVFSGPAVVNVPEDSALVINPAGAIVEQRSQPVLGDMLLGGAAALRSTRLQDLLDAVERAADDPRISALVLHLDDMLAIDPAQMESLQEALAAFRESGKSIHAYGQYYTQGQYALAAHADTVMLHPMGNLLLPGYGGNQLFFRDLLEQLNVTMHVFRAGEYKSAAEPFTRMDFSEASRENNQQLVDELWNRYVERTASARGMETARLREYAERFPELLQSAGGDMAQVALQQGLVDEVGSLAQFRRQMVSRVGQQDESFRQIGFRDYLNATTEPELPAEQRVGVIVAEGTIMAGEQPPGMIGAENTSRLIRHAAADDSIRAVVLRINSPGGGAVASETIRSELERLRQQGKPVVVSMGGTAASGGYWIASAADRIWASPTTLTGSIGVVSAIPSFENALSEFGVGVDGVGTTPLTRNADPLSGFSDSMRSILQVNVDNTYQRFLNHVAEGRGMDIEDVREVAEGRVWSGARAQELGLVDNLGDLSDAVDAAAGMADLENWQRARIQRPRSFAERILEQVLENADPGPALQTLLGTGGTESLSRTMSPALRAIMEQLIPRIKESGRPKQLMLCEFCLSLQAAPAL